MYSVDPTPHNMTTDPTPNKVATTVKPTAKSICKSEIISSMKYKNSFYLKKGVGGSYITEHGNWPIFPTEFGKIVYILADFGEQE